MNVAMETNEALKNDTEISRIKSYCKSIEPCVCHQDLYSSTENISTFLCFHSELYTVSHFPGSGLCYMLPKIIHGELSERATYGDSYAVVDLCIYCEPMTLIDEYF